MKHQAWPQRIRAAIPGLSCKEQASMAEYTSLKVGGPADLLAEPADLAQLRALLAFCRAEQIPLLVAGLGSNLLVRDGGLRGVTVLLRERFAQLRVEEDRLCAQAGARLTQLARCAYEAGLGGLEFASGIPGSLGGAIAMNAGAYGGEMQQVVESVDLLDEALQEVRLSGAEMQFGYRHSLLSERPQWVVTAACLRLPPREKAQIKAQMDDLSERRRSKQPLQYPSAGSFFKRPPGYYAGALIEQAGLKGCRVGGAMVSDLHAGFLINTGKATATDVLQLMALVQQKVQQNSGVWLEPEVRIIGEELR